LGLQDNRKIGEILCGLSYLDEGRLEDSLERQRVKGGRLGRILIELGFVSAGQLGEGLSLQAGLPVADLEELEIGRDIISRVPAELVSKYSVLPVGGGDGRLDVAMVNPFDAQAIEELSVVTGCSINRHFARLGQIEKAILKYYGSNVARMVENLAPHERSEGAVGGDISGEDALTAARLHELAREPSLVNLVNLILLEAVEARASDVHIEPFEKQVRIKYRIDGMLVDKSTSPKKLQAAIISRVKIMAGMDIAERFVPQDGHIEFMGNAGKIDIRVSTVPTIFGESITMRILDRSAALIDLDELGMSEGTLASFNKSLGRSHGIVLVTGPTGSGKTTTLYAALNRIYSPSLKIITIEDPVEYQLEGIIQMPVNPRRGLTFSRGLRHILRQDPNIIMVGEIRDRETADIAIRAALTGHLVFSTLHTNDAAGAITRLIDMGVEPFLLAGSLEAVLAQRLVRRVCPHCMEPYDPPQGLIDSLSNSVTIPEGATVYQGRGCDHCRGSGFLGRVGIFELLSVNDSIRKLIAERPTSDQILRAAKGHRSMRHDGIEKILARKTTCQEVLRATQSSEE
jgi:type II secretory ATPase GspE/PulE/Tfp pilus assembly ATPase PilB-like protein